MKPSKKLIEEVKTALDYEYQHLSFYGEENEKVVQNRFLAGVDLMEFDEFCSDWGFDNCEEYKENSPAFKETLIEAIKGWKYEKNNKRINKIT